MNMFEFFYLYLHRLIVWGTYRWRSLSVRQLHTGVYCALVLTYWNPENSNVSQKQGNVTPLGVWLYTWGFDVARLPLTGRFPEPQYVKRASERLHVLYCFWLRSRILFYIRLGAWRKCLNTWAMGYVLRFIGAILAAAVFAAIVDMFHFLFFFFFSHFIAHI